MIGCTGSVHKLVCSERTIVLLLQYVETLYVPGIFYIYENIVVDPQLGVWHLCLCVK